MREIIKFSSKTNRQKLVSLVCALVFLISSLAPFVFPTPTQATAVNAYIRLDRLGINATGGGLVCFTPEGGGTAAHVVVTFPGNGTAGAASFGVNTTAANWTTTTTNLPAGTTAWPGIGTATTVSGASVTFPSSSLTNGTTYCFNFAATSTLTNPSSIGSGNTLTGTIITQTVTPTTIDTDTYALAIVTTNADQVSVTATVPQSLTFALSANSIAFGTLTLGSTITGGTTPTVTITTNAQNGYTAWVKSLNGALSSAGTGGSIPSATANIASTKGYGMQSGSPTGNATTVSPYNVSGTNVGALATTYTPFMSYTGPSVAAGDSVTLTLKAYADSTVKAASDYADTQTLSAGGGWF